MPIQQRRNDEDDYEREEGRGEQVASSPSSNHKKTQMIIAGSLIALTVAIVGYIYFTGKGDKGSGDTTVITETAAVDQSSGKGSSDKGADPSRPWLSGDNSAGTDNGDKSTQTPGSTKPKDDNLGIKDISGDTTKVNTLPITPKDQLTKTFSGVKAPIKYQIISTNNIVDFVSYKLHRSTTDAGIETYWLDATYKGRKAIITVPFAIAKEMDPVGVTVVDVEITQVVDNDGKAQDIVTGFTVRTDYKQLLEGRN